VQGRSEGTQPPARPRPATASVADCGTNVGRRRLLRGSSRLRVRACTPTMTAAMTSSPDGTRPWYHVLNVDEIASPALLVYLDRVDDNIRDMIAVAGGVDRLRPHVKTHKLPEVIRRQLVLGIQKFKCATIAEAEMLGECGCPDVLLAYQPVGPNIHRLWELAARYPSTAFSAVVDDEGIVRRISEAFRSTGRTIELLVDLDSGMHRSGISPVDAAGLYALIANLPGIAPGGLHAYDGHIRDADITARAAASDAAFEPVARLGRDLEGAGFAVPRVVVGGTPTFPVHARRSGVELSPGTCIFWDAGYGSQLPDLPFRPAALVLTRVVSRPGAGRLCLDLGHKAIASENPHPRVQLLDLPDATPVIHSEEHLVLETPRAERIAVGEAVYGIPWHICPTVALYGTAVVIDDHRATGSWRVLARERALTV
jgi:D-threonine aldolase